MSKQQQLRSTPERRPTPYVHQMPAAGPGAVEVTFRIHAEHGPALRSALEEIRAEVGGRIEGAHRFAKEAALTRAAVALGSLAAAVNRAFPNADPDY